MPIANCFVQDGVTTGAGIKGLTDLWARESGIGDEHMTINVIAATRQEGARYGVMAFLYLPALPPG